MYGSSMLSHCLLGAGLSDTVKIGSGFDPLQGMRACVCACVSGEPEFSHGREEIC